MKVALKNQKSSRESFLDHNNTDSEKKIHELSNQVFQEYQRDWSDFNFENIKNYTTDNYYKHATLMLEALKSAGRQNKVESVRILSTALDSPVSDNLVDPIEIRIRYTFSAVDIVYDTKTSEKLFEKDYHGIEETWNYIYENGELKLSGISQPTESSAHTFRAMARFAGAKGLFYSPDWGRYCLPNKGLIFDNDSLYIADVNNHIIGKWDETLVQLYTYAPGPGRTPSSYYIVGQLNVPKEYLGIVVKEKSFKIKKPADYEKFELEWADFNKKYEVFASSADALPAFELLEPNFMTYLHDKNLKYNIEVIGNAIYIYAPVTDIKEENYSEILDVLVEAYKRLKR